MCDTLIDQQVEITKHILNYTKALTRVSIKDKKDQDGDKNRVNSFFLHSYSDDDSELDEHVEIDTMQIKITDEPMETHILPSPRKNEK